MKITYKENITNGIKNIYCKKTKRQNQETTKNIQVRSNINKRNTSLWNQMIYNMGKWSKDRLMQESTIKFHQQLQNPTTYSLHSYIAPCNFIVNKVPQKTTPVSSIHISPSSSLFSLTNNITLSTRRRKQDKVEIFLHVWEDRKISNPLKINIDSTYQFPPLQQYFSTDRESTSRNRQVLLQLCLVTNYNMIHIQTKKG